jgi:tRNA threonylcarbamoyladenosine modification (KEOPS) complex  Pcc1 subunit
MTCDLMADQMLVYDGENKQIATSTRGTISKYDIDTATHTNFLESGDVNLTLFYGFKNGNFVPGVQPWALALNPGFPLGSAPGNPETPLTYAPTISPGFPPNGINTTTTNMTDWNATGTITASPLDVNTWYLLHISLVPIDEYGLSSITSYYGTYVLNLTAGENIAYTIPATDFKTSGGASLPDGVYQVTYTMIGKTPALDNVQYSFSPPGTIIRDQEMPIFATSTTPASFEIVSLEDCSTLGFPNKWFCEIKNAAIGIFAPTGQKIAEFKSTIGEINNRFPINYIKTAQSSWQNIYDNISASSSPITLTILGNTGSINFNVFDSSGLKTVIQSFFGLIFISLFIFWAVKYIQRIF